MLTAGEMKTDHYKTRLNNKEVPDSNEEYFIYQTLTGAMPFTGKQINSFSKGSTNTL